MAKSIDKFGDRFDNLQKAVHQIILEELPDVLMHTQALIEFCNNNEVYRKGLIAMMLCSEKVGEICSGAFLEQTRSLVDRMTNSDTDDRIEAWNQLKELVNGKKNKTKIKNYE